MDGAGGTGGAPGTTTGSPTGGGGGGGYSGGGGGGTASFGDGGGAGGSKVSSNAGTTTYAPATSGAGAGGVAGATVGSPGAAGSDGAVEITPGPAIAGAATAAAFTTTYGTASAAQGFSLSGVNLWANITATAPAGFEVSSDGTTYGGTATFTQSGGSASGTLRLRLAATAAVSGSYNSQTIALTSSYATTVYVTTAASGNTVSTKALGVTGLAAADKFYDGTVTASLSGTPALVPGDIVGSDNVSLVSGGTPVGAFADAEVGSGKAVSYASGLTLQGTAAGNYHLTGSATSAAILGTKPVGDTTTTTITVANSQTFDLTLNAGQLLANNDPAGGSINGSGTIQVNSGATLGGSGKVGQVSVNAGGTIAPGNSVGTLSSDSQTWEPSGNYEWEINDALGTAGSDPGWDLLSINGTLDITATSGSKFTTYLATLAGNVAGSAAHFNNAYCYAWPIATASVGVTGFSADAFTVDTSGFQNAVGVGSSFSVSNYAKSVYVVYAPACVKPATATHFYDGSVMHVWFTNRPGLAEVKASKMVNCTVTCTAYSITGATLDSGLNLANDGTKLGLPPGTTGIQLFAYRSSGTASINLMAFNSCGDSGGTDPSIVDLVVGPDGVVTKRIEGIPSMERYLQVFNGQPGLQSLTVAVNGHTLPVGPLLAGGRCEVDLASILAEGDNTLVFTGTGGAGANAIVILSDTPANAVAAAPALTVTLSSGGVEISWLGAAGQWQLQVGAAMGATWENVPTAPTAQAGRNRVVESLGAGSRFFRLQSASGNAAAQVPGTASSASLSGAASQPTLNKTYGDITW